MEKDNQKERERNIVAEQQNWNQRVRTELDSARIWNECWGQLYCKDVPADYEERIKYLQAQVASLPGQSLQSVMRSTHTGAPPFQEILTVPKHKKIDDLFEPEA